jgi:hypothetical protein
MKLQRQHIAIFIALLFHISALVGILFTPYKNWFIQNTPLNLLLMGLLLAWNQRGKLVPFLIFFLVAAVTGFVAEWIGVQTGALFGTLSLWKYPGTSMGWCSFTDRPELVRRGLLQRQHHEPAAALDEPAFDR